MNEPVIKWSGSKRSQAGQILTHFPSDIKTYYEPFCGGASVFRALLDSGINAEAYVLSDVNGDLMALWEAVKSRPADICAHYERLWRELNRDDDLERKKEYFAGLRARFNKYKDPLDFMFIMRTVTNGMPRYNRKGEFNNSLHITRPGIDSARLTAIVYEWSRLLTSNDVVFLNCSYREINPCKGDFMYLDPPYANTKGMYYGKIDYDELWAYLRELPCEYLLSFDGRSGDCDRTYDVPPDIYSGHEYIRSGNSSFKRVIGKSRDSIVFESLYYG